MSAAEEVKRRLDIIEVVSPYVQLRKAGKTHKGLCPFHAEKTPSLVVYPEEGRWYCFGACGTGGDVFTFVMKRENLTFPEALRQLARQAGVPLETSSPQVQQERQRREKLAAMLQAAADYYHRLLQQADAARGTREYLHHRGLTEEMIGRFQLGYALDSWDGIRKALQERGYSDQEMVAGGLLIEGERGPYDRFRGRLMFPIRERRASLVGFGARALQPEQQPKYLNSPQTELFDKSSLLYGIDLAHQTIRASGQAVLVEGYTDVIAAHQHGHRNAVASLGTSLTEPQMRTLKRLTGEIVLALDADAAGLEATLRGLEVAQEVAGEERPVALGPRLIRHERRLAMSIRVVTLPQGEDPDQTIRRDPQGWPALLQEARPLAEFLFERLVQGLDLRDARDKVKAAERLLPLVREMSSEVERRHYLAKLARMTQTDEPTLLAEMQRLARSPLRRSAGQRPRLQLPAQPGFSPDAYLLALLLRHPAGPEELPLEDGELEQPEHRAILAHLKGGEFLEEVIEPALQETLRELEERASALPELAEEELQREIQKTLWHVKERRCRREIAQVHYLLTQAEDPQEEQLLRRRAAQLQAELRSYQQARETFSLAARVRGEGMTHTGSSATGASPAAKTG